ncbi:MAG: alkaline phosphatase, partial [Vallitaleaceae bacterium]|nr:alkaline phosphatase [Vallitaleaceae bacterium]
MNIREASEPNVKVKNVIVMIPDGMSVGAITLARWYKSYDVLSKTVDPTKSLALDEMASGLVRTYWEADGFVGAITDSAPAGTALACGVKTKDQFIGSLPSKAPIASILEAARSDGKATGIVATSNIQHATPADFSAHYFDRNKYLILAEQQVYAGMDVVLGGGSKYLAGRTTDGENLINAIREHGYTYVTDKTGLSSVKSGKVWGMFAPDAMAYDIDIKAIKPTEPTLAEMTTKSIELLSQDNDGFFLMVEGSKVDWAAHANDPVAIISDVIAFDDAVKVALDYAKKHQDTMVLCITDHGNGGITMGNVDTTATYNTDSVEKFIAPLKKATLTGEGVEAKLDKERTNIKEVMSTYFGISDLTDSEVSIIKAAAVGKVNSAVGPIISRRAFIGWTTGGHTGEDV